mgnify:CR=1 FL=1
MVTTVQLATARELAAAGSVQDTLLVGRTGGYAVLFKLGIGERALVVVRIRDVRRALEQSAGQSKHVVDAASLHRLRGLQTLREFCGRKEMLAITVAARRERTPLDSEPSKEA